jgi:membrane protease YdiL (CAAX protease family)
MRKQVTWQRIAILITLFFLLWISAWIVHNHLASFGIHLTTGSAADTVYWLLAKFLVWVAFPFLFFAQPLQKQLEFIGLQARNIRRGLAFGAVAATLWIALSFVRFFLTGQHIAFTTDLFTAFYTAVLTPIFEEIMFRGYIQSALIALKTNIFLADILTTALFLIPHGIGWSFQGVLPANLAPGVIGAIAVVSLLVGYVRYKSDSLIGSFVLHIVNNLLSLFMH